MIKVSVAAVLLALGTVATPALAGTIVYDAAASFNGTSNPSGAFSFGQYDGTTLSPFTAFSNCATGLRCLLSSNEAALGIYKNTSGAPVTAFTTVDVPTGALFLHPGPSSQAYVLFTAPTSGVYTLNMFFKLLSNSTITGTTVSAFYDIGGIISPAGSVDLTAATPYLVGSPHPLLLDAGEGILLTLGNAGDYSYDSTQFGFSFSSAVPEPASWALMIVGFAMTGAAMRRRAVLAA